MIRCGFEQGAALMGCTSVQNIFILEYMPKAPELYCKVYLFGLMQCGCRRLENADLCASLGIDSAKAVEAFLYWQDMGLLRRDDILHALPAQPPPLRTVSRARVSPGVYVAGDHRDTASIQGALVSGDRVARTVLADLEGT